MNRKVFVILIALTVIFTLLLSIGCNKHSDDESSGDKDTPGGDVVSSGNDNVSGNIDSGDGNGGNSGDSVDSGDNVEEHVHTFDKEWSTDSRYHWFASTCEHNLKKDKENHSFDDKGMCNVCKYYNSYGLSYQLNSDNNTYSIIGLEDDFDSAHLVIPQTYKGKKITMIAEKAFADCEFITDVTVSDSITCIGAFAFDGCKSLTGVYISDMTSWCNINFKSSRSNPLEYAQKLYLNNQLVTNLTIPESVDFIDSYAFFNCVDLIGISVDENNDTYKSQDNCVITKDSNSLVLGCVNSIIPSYVKSIGPSAFESCKGLTKIEIPSSVTIIGYDAFKNCENLTNIKIPSTVTDIRDGAFANCRSLEQIDLPISLNRIGIKAFANCTSLTIVDIPFGTQTIDQGAFSFCVNLTKVTIPKGVIQIGNFAFVNCPNLTVYCNEISQPSGWDEYWSGNCKVVYGNNIQ